MAKAAPHRWCLLIHSVPARPLYLRARVRRLLAASGAAPIKKSVYALPASAAALDALRGIAAEIEAGGGSAFVCEATFPDDEVDRSVVRAFNDELHRHYRGWIREASATLRPPSGGRGAGAKLPRLRGRLESLRAVDRFAAPGAAEATAVLARLERDATAETPRPRKGWIGLAWVTRRGVHIDRIACAWVVRRFIDPVAVFRFTATPDAALAKGEIGFDMPGAEVGHEAGGCSVETLVRRAGIADPAVARIAEVVHDVDLKDGRFGHPENAGFEQMLVGVLASTAGDPERIERGLPLFDALYAALSRGRGLPAAAATPPPRIAVPPGLRRRRPRA